MAKFTTRGSGFEAWARAGNDRPVGIFQRPLRGIDRMMPVAISWNCCVKHLDEFGWNGHWQQVLAREGGSDLEAVGRVVQEHKEAYLVRAAMGNVWAEISGKMRHVGVVRSDFPAVGDWVLL